MITSQALKGRDCFVQTAELLVNTASFFSQLGQRVPEIHHHLPFPFLLDARSGVLRYYTRTRLVARRDDDLKGSVDRKLFVLEAWTLDSRGLTFSGI